MLIQCYCLYCVFLFIKCIGANNVGQNYFTKFYERVDRHKFAIYVCYISPLLKHME